MTVFEELINMNGIHVSDIAKFLNLSRPTIYRKLKNNSFTYNEMVWLRNKYYDGMNIEELFSYCAE